MCAYLVLGMWVRTSSTPRRSRPERKLKKVLAAVASSPCTRLEYHAHHFCTCAFSRQNQPAHTLSPQWQQDPNLNTWSCPSLSVWSHVLASTLQSLRLSMSPNFLYMITNRRAACITGVEIMPALQEARGFTNAKNSLATPETECLHPRYNTCMSSFHSVHLAEVQAR